MAETLSTADGRAIPLDQTDAAFAAAMAAPRGDEPEHPAPPAREPVDPAAPYGRKLDGTPKKRPGGRPPRPREIEAPRSSPSSPSSPSSSASSGPLDYSQGLAEFSEALWMVMAATPIPWETVRVRIRAQAWVLNQNREGVVSGVNIMAQHNATIRAGVERVTTGSAGWVLPAVMALAPFAVQTAMIWRSPANGDMLDLAEQTEQQWHRTFADMRAQFEAEMAAAAEAGFAEAADAAAGGEPADGPAATPAAAAA